MTDGIGTLADPSEDPGGEDGTSMEGRHLWWFAGGVLVAGVLALLARPVLTRASTLYPGTLPANPYLVPEHALLLYGAVPVTVVGLFGFFLAPGTLLVIAAGRARGLTRTVLEGFAASVVWYLLASTALKLLGGPLGPSTLFGLTLAGSLASWSGTAFRVGRSHRLPLPRWTSTTGRRLVWLIVIPAALAAATVPAMVWENFNGDGFEAYAMGRSLIDHVLPLNTSQEIVTGGNGMVSSALLTSWFVALLGPLEAAARLPFLLEIPLLFIGLLGLAEIGLPRRAGILEEIGLVLGLLAYVLAMGYSASYHPYSADLAAPGASDTLPVLCLVGLVYFLWRGELVPLLFYAVAGYFARPTGLVFVVLVGGSAFFAYRKDRERRNDFARRAMAALGVCLVAMAAYRYVLLPASGQSASPGGTFAQLTRFAFVTIDDVDRLGYWLIPSGILPGFVLALPRWHDRLGRALAVVVAAYFVLVYLPAFVALHHFAPLMVLPLAIFWRGVARRRGAWWLRVVGIVGLAGSIWLSLPRSFHVDRSLRSVGEATIWRIGGSWSAGDEAYRRAAAHREIVHLFFPPDYLVADPYAERGVTPGAVVFYATRPGGPPPDARNYFVVRESVSPPGGYTAVGSDAGGVAYVRDMERWNRDRRPPLAADFRSTFLRVPRETMFRHLGVPARNYSLSPARLACRSGLQRWLSRAKCEKVLEVTDVSG